MNELTDREKELVKWIVFLMDMVNRYALFVALLHRDIKWLDDACESFNTKEKQEEMVEVLVEKFGLSLTLQTNVDGLKKMEEIQKKEEDE